MVPQRQEASAKEAMLAAELRVVESQLFEERERRREEVTGLMRELQDRQARWQSAAAEGWATASREAKRRHASQLAQLSSALSSSVLPNGTACDNMSHVYSSPGGFTSPMDGMSMTGGYEAFQSPATGHWSNQAASTQLPRRGLSASSSTPNVHGASLHSPVMESRMLTPPHSAWREWARRPPASPIRAANHA